MSSAYHRVLPRRAAKTMPSAPDSTPTPRETPLSTPKVGGREELAAIALSPSLSEHDVALLLTLARRLL